MEKAILMGLMIGAIATIAMATTGMDSISQVLAQNMTTGDNLTGGETGNMTAAQTGKISSSGDGPWIATNPETLGP
jgi:hypothetical protein